MYRLGTIAIALALIPACDDGPASPAQSDARLDAASAPEAAVETRPPDSPSDYPADAMSDRATDEVSDGPADAPTDLAADSSPDTSSDLCGGCTGGLSCLECPKGGPAAKYICTTRCTRNEDCNDPARPKCNLDPMFAPQGICTASDEICRWGSRCASPETPVATPGGERPIAGLRPGDLVLSTAGGSVVAVPIGRVIRLPVSDHHVVRVHLDTGATIEMSEGHPTADGRRFGDLTPGAGLGSAVVTGVQSVPYRHHFTHDILPASADGTYFAGGALVGSTLAPGR